MAVERALEKSIRDIEAQAHTLAARIPALLVEARRVAHTITHGIHGRRRAGPGETFWQFRHYQDNDTAALVDWRRSASSDHLYVREREWEAAHTVWLWPDLSPSMMFSSHLSSVSKHDRALVLTFALGELLVQAGERIGLMGLLAPTSSRFATTRLAEAIVDKQTAGDELEGLPPKAKLSPHSECVIFSDCLESIDVLVKRLDNIAGQGVRGHVVQVFDPAEETLPYSGRTEFEAREGLHRVLTGRAESLREGYRERLESHRARLREHMRRLEWSFLVHHTDRPAGETLLALHTKLAGLEQDYRHRDIGDEFDAPDYSPTGAEHGDSP